MNKSENQIKFTGEFFVPGESGERIELDHMERYRFACGYIKNKEVLDLACGFGYAGPLLLKEGAKSYEGVDINKHLVDNANSIYGTDCIKYYQGDICSYNSNKTFDIITCFETIEHVREYQNALINLYNLLKTNGTLIISSPNRLITSPNAKYLSDKPLNEYHEQEFTIEELKSVLISIGFSVGSDNIFGQRNSILYFRNKFLNKIGQYFFGDQSLKSSPKVSRKLSKFPRYFIIVAKK